MPKPLSKYIGGKSRLAIKLISMMPPHETYIEGFAGMASVYLAKPRASNSIINDINDSIVNLYEVARDYPELLVKMVELTPFAKRQYEEWITLYLDRKEEYQKLSRVKQALVFYYVMFCAFSGNYTANRKLNTFSVTSAGAWGGLNQIDNIRAFAKFTQGTVFTNMDYRDLLRKYCRPDSFVYLDPPYVIAEAANYYEYNFTDKDHQELRATVDKVSADTGAKFMLSYDDVDAIKELWKGYYQYIIEDVSQSSGTPDEEGEKPKKNELVITNYSINNVGLFA